MGIPQLNFDRIQVVDPTQGALDAVNSAKSSLNDILRQGLAEEEVAQNKLVQDRDYAMRVKADARIGTEFDQKQSARSARQKFNEVYGKGPQAVIVDGLVTDEFVADGGQEGVEKRLGIAAPVVNKETGVVVYTPEDQKKLDNYYGAFSNIVDKRSAMLGNETELELLGRAEKAAEEGGYDPEIADIVKAGRAAEISRIDTLRKALEADKTLAEKDRIEAGGKAVKSNLVTTGTSSYSDSVNRTKSLGGEASGKTKDSSGGVDLGHSAELKDMTIKQIKDEVGLSFGDEAKADAKIKEAIDKGFSYKQIHAMLSQSVDLSWTGDTIDTAMMDKLMSKAKPESTSNGDGTETRESSSRSNSRSSSTTSHGFMANPA
jgi:hypothetical protein